jgi:CheY-like chemotaxis protein
VGKAKILVVDDERVIRDLVKRVLAEEGYKVDTVDNAADALKKIEGKRYNLILLDIKMPGMDGVRIIQAYSKDSSVVSPESSLHHRRYYGRRYRKVPLRD